MHKRSAAIDVVRVIGIIAIIFGHVWDSGSRLIVYPWHVALFFFLTGYFWQFDRSLKEEFRKRQQTLIIPLGTWSIIIALVSLSAMLGDRGFDLKRTVEDLIDGQMPTRPFMVFWFVFVLLFVAVLLRLLQRTKWLPAWLPWISAVGGLALAYVAGPQLSETPLYIGLTLPCLSFVLAGIVFRRYRGKFSQWIAWLLLALSGILISTHISAPMDMKPGNFGTPVLSVLVAVAICAAMVILAEQYSSLIPEAAGNLATALASCALVVILTHAGVIFIAEGLPQVAVFALAVVLPWTAGLLFLKSPVSLYVTGVGPQARTLASTGRASHADRISLTHGEISKEK